MQLKEQVCSLDLALRLKELGVKRLSFAYWYEDDQRSGPYVRSGDAFVDFGGIVRKPNCSAFTVAELGEMLPAFIALGHVISYMHTVKIEDAYRCCYVNGSGVVARDGCRLQFAEKSEADARAKMLIYLLENRLVMAA